MFLNGPTGCGSGCMNHIISNNGSMVTAASGGNLSRRITAIFVHNCSLWKDGSKSMFVRPRRFNSTCNVTLETHLILLPVILWIYTCMYDYLFSFQNNYTWTTNCHYVTIVCASLFFGFIEYIKEPITMLLPVFQLLNYTYRNYYLDGTVALLWSQIHSLREINCQANEVNFESFITRMSGITVQQFDHCAL